MTTAEILAPAGGPDSLLAAVRCGANAVYLGGRALNARRSAANFDGDGLRDAVRYCHARGVKVYFTLNTLIFDSELETAADLISSACKAGVDALIVQDLAVAAMARECAPSLPLHASTQMAVHNSDGVALLKELGFSRAVLARELSQEEIAEIARDTAFDLECFVHGALCMCFSGGCYFSSILGGRSGNRGLCAQPCRLPMSFGENGHCLSLKDLSFVTRIPELLDAGVRSFKIEGRMKRAEYVAAAVTAINQKLAGESPDLGALRSVFSRDGFTDGYFYGALGPEMFGTRSREDVLAASSALLKDIAASYRDERPLVPVDFSLTLKEGIPASLTASDNAGHSVTVTGGVPLEAVTAPTTSDKAAAALSKTGGTPFFASSVSAETDSGLMLPVSGLNALRRSALEALLELRETPEPHTFADNPELFRFSPHKAHKPTFRARIGDAGQFCEELADACELVMVPAEKLCMFDTRLLKRYSDKIAVELPRVVFGRGAAQNLVAALEDARQNGISRAVAGNLGTIELARGMGFDIHGDWPLNITNSLSISEYAEMGIKDVTLSFELTKGQVAMLGGSLPRGIVAYGYLPLMLTRNCPGGFNGDTEDGFLTDRLGNRFHLRRMPGAYEVLNCVPMFLSDRLSEFENIDFFTLYFTHETPEECARVLRLYQTGGKTDMPKTRGLYFRGVE